MLPTPRTAVRAALLALLALAVLLTSGCATTVADAQGPYPYPPPTVTTAPPTTAPPTTAPPTTAPPTTAPPTTAPPTTVPPRTPTPTPRPSTGLPNTAGGSFPILVGVALLALAGAVALARRRIS